MLSEKKIKKLEFKKVKSYDHDQYHTNRYEKGSLQVEFTYENCVLINVDLTIEEINSIEIKQKDLQLLDLILNKPPMSKTKNCVHYYGAIDKSKLVSFAKCVKCGKFKY